MRVVLSMVVFAVATAGLAAEPEKKYTSKDGKFAVQFPGSPQTAVKTVGELQAHMFSLSIEKQSVNHLVIYTDMPASVVKGSSAPTLLKSGEDGLANFFKTKITKSSEKQFKSGGKEYPAREINAEKGDIQMRITIILAGNRLYQVMVFGAKDAVNGKGTDDFLQSFEITG